MLQIKLIRTCSDSRYRYDENQCCWVEVVDTRREIQFTLFERWKFTIPIEPMRTWEF